MKTNNPPRWVLTSAAIGLAFVVGAIVLAASGFDPILGYASLFGGVLTRPSDMVNVVLYATPLILTGLSVAFAFKTGLFNIGAEGQFIVGALTASLVGAFFPFHGFFLAPLTVAVAMFAAAAWGALAGWIKARFGVHEVITTIMLNWIALYLNNFVVMLDGIRRPESQSTQTIDPSAHIDLLSTWKISPEGLQWRAENPFWDEILRNPLNWGIVVALALTVATAFLIKRTTLGFELQAVGHNADAARANGISIPRSLIYSMGIAGALAGCAGALHVLGNTHQASLLAVMEGNGFDGIAVALMGNSTPWGTVLAALFFGLLKQGSGYLQFDLGAPTEVISIVVGTVIFFLAVPGIFLIFRRRKRRVAS